MKGLVAVFTTSLFAILVPVAGAQSAMPPTLTGEAFHDGAPTITSVACEPPSLGGTFAARGTATGPYPGTFHETGSVVGSPGPETFTASFTIDSSVGHVTGSKRSTFLGVACALDGTFFSFNSDESSPGNAYDATIVTASGAFADNGSFGVSFQQGTTPTPGFDESFSSSLASPTPLFPTSIDQCENAGWANYGTTFKNQGDCVSFVATGGKNPPSGRSSQ
jgi:hypothetical protein